MLGKLSLGLFLYFSLFNNCHKTCVSPSKIRSSRPDVFLGKVVLKICSKFTGEHPCRSAILRKLQSNFIESNFIEIALRHGCFPVNLLHIFKTPFLKNTSGWLLLADVTIVSNGSFIWETKFYSSINSVFMKVSTVFH